MHPRGNVVGLIDGTLGEELIAQGARGGGPNGAGAFARRSSLRSRGDCLAIGCTAVFANGMTEIFGTGNGGDVSTRLPSTAVARSGRNGRLVDLQAGVQATLPGARRTAVLCIPSALASIGVSPGEVLLMHTCAEGPKRT